MLFKNFQEAYKAIAEEFGSFQAFQIIEYVTGISKSKLLQIWEKPLEQSCSQEIQDIVYRRRKGQPLQYIFGEWEFFGLPFKVGPGVLIPRPDTETLVEIALELAGKDENLEILDVCSGSGCVAIALEKNLLNAKVTAVELSEQAFEYLKKNIVLNAAKVTAVNEDALEYRHPKKLDIIVSNPPYIAQSEMDKLQKEVKQEPRMALEGGEDGLDFYRKISALYFEQLKIGGYLAFEIGVDQHKAVAKIMQDVGFENIKTRNDLAGITRVVYAEKQQERKP